MIFLRATYGFSDASSAESNSVFSSGWNIGCHRTLCISGHLKGRPKQDRGSGAFTVKQSSEGEIRRRTGYVLRGRVCNTLAVRLESFD